MRACPLGCDVYATRLHLRKPFFTLGVRTSNSTETADDGESSSDVGCWQTNVLLKRMLAVEYELLSGSLGSQLFGKFE